MIDNLSFQNIQRRWNAAIPYFFKKLRTVAGAISGAGLAFIGTEQATGLKLTDIENHAIGMIVGLGAGVAFVCTVTQATSTQATSDQAVNSPPADKQ